MAEQPRRGILLALAAEGMIPVVGGCAGALAGGPEAGVVGGMLGVAVGQAVEKVINFFGARIVERWGDWFRTQSPDVRQLALNDLASLAPEEARKQAAALLDQLVLEPISAADKEIALSYLSLLPGSVDRALPREHVTGLRSIPPTITFDEPAQLLSLMPMTLPPYPVGTEVPGTPYRLEGLLGTGGFGAVYRASTRSLQHLPLAIKFCLDPALAQSLQRERTNLERLMKAGGQEWSPRVVRLYGYDLEHKTPYLVYEFVTGGDLLRYVAEQREKLGRALNPDEVLELILQTTEALAFAHQHGLVHRDLKPANVLVESGVLKLADFGLGSVTAARAAQVSRIGATTVDTLCAAEQASLFRGSGTPLYMSPEQRRGQSPDPRQDLYSLGVMWYQLLVGDVSRELHPGWAKELSLRFGVPKAHLNLIESCVGWFDERPKNAAELLQHIRDLRDQPPAALPVIAFNPATLPLAAAPPSAKSDDHLRRGLLYSMIKTLHEGHQKVASLEGWASVIWPAVVAGIVGAGMTEGKSGPIRAVVLVFAGLGAVSAWYVRFWRQGDAELKLTEAIRALTKEFPEEVRDWGGEVTLRNSTLVAQIAQKFGVVEPPSMVDTVIPTMDAGQKKEISARLAKLGEVVEHASGFSQRKPFPWLVAGMIALIVGIPSGLGAGAAYWGYKGPISYYGPLSSGYSETAYFNVNGVKLDRAAYLHAEKVEMAIAAIIGTCVGAMLSAILAYTLTYQKWHRMHVLFGCLVGAILAGGIGAGSGLIYYSLRGPYFDYNNSGGYVKYYDSSGLEIKPVEYRLMERNAFTNSMFLGFGLGTFGMFAVAVVMERWHDRRGKRARQEADREAIRFVSDFPAFAASTGGVAALNEPTNISDLISKLA